MTHPKTARPDHQILDLIRDRWSPRAFDAARAVEREDLRRLFEAARWAPSSGNEQPWRFIVAERETDADVYGALSASLTGRNPLWAGAAPVLVLVAVQTTTEHAGRPNPHAWYDAGQAVAFLTLQATSLGLAVRQMEGFSADAARQACAVPPAFEPVVVMAIGYAGNPDSLEYEKHRAAERTPRSRRPLADFVFAGVWGGKF